jgi:hypothetical protein
MMDFFFFLFQTIARFMKLKRVMLIIWISKSSGYGDGVQAEKNMNSTYCGTKEMRMGERGWELCVKKDTHVLVFNFNLST